MIEVRHLQKYYGDFLALEDISFSLRPGQALGLIGSNGAGKSTTIKIIIGLIAPTGGEVLIGGRAMTLDALPLKRRIGYMPEESALYEDLDALTFLRFFAELYDVEKKTAERRIAALLSELKLDNKVIGMMSKGMKRKLLIARSLLADPAILVYDEPASGIDPETTEFILHYILQMKRKGKIVIITGHNLHHVERISDRIIMLKRGRVVYDDTVHNLKRQKTYVLRYRDDGRIHEKEYRDLARLNADLARLVEEGKTIIDFRQQEPTLEELFLSLASRDDAARAP